MAHLPVTSSPCPKYDWSPIAGAVPESAVAAVLAGFVFAGIVVVFSTKPTHEIPAARALKLLFVAFLGLTVTAFLMADVGGGQVCSQADSVVTATGGLFATFAVLMLISLTWLAVAYDRDENQVLAILRWAVLVGSAFVVLLLGVSSQSYLSQELHMSLSGDFGIFGTTLVLAGVSIVVISVTRRRLARLEKALTDSANARSREASSRPGNGRPADREARKTSRSRRLRWSSLKVKLWDDEVNRCAATALAYLAIVGLGSGAVLGFPQNWYMPINNGLAYAVAWTALVLPFPVLVFAGLALPRPTRQNGTADEVPTQGGAIQEKN
jgi:hypothetical protein